MTEVKYKPGSEIRKRVYTIRPYVEEGFNKYFEDVDFEVECDSLDMAIRRANWLLHHYDVHHVIIDERVEYVGNEFHFNTLMKIMAWGR